MDRFTDMNASAYTDRFGRVDIFLASVDEVTVSNSHGKIAEGVWCEQGLLDFDFVAPFDNGVEERSYRKLRDAVEEAIERKLR